MIEIFGLISTILIIYTLCAIVIISLLFWLRAFFYRIKISKKDLYEEALILKKISHETKFNYLEKRLILFPTIFDYLKFSTGEFQDYLISLIKSYGYEKKLIKNLHSRAKWKRMYGAYYLGILKSNDALSYLVHLLNQKKEYDEKLTISKALIKISGEKYINIILETMCTSSNHITMMELIKELDNIKPFLEHYFIQKNNINCTCFAIIALAERKWEGVFQKIDELIISNETTDILTGLKAIINLKEFGQGSFREKLISLTLHNSIEIRRNAAISLRYQNSLEAIDALLSLLSDIDLETRFLAGESLLNYPMEKGIEALYLKAQTGNEIEKDISWHILQKYELTKNNNCESYISF